MKVSKRSLLVSIISFILCGAASAKTIQCLSTEVIDINKGRLLSFSQDIQEVVTDDAEIKIELAALGLPSSQELLVGSVKVKGYQEFSNVRFIKRDVNYSNAVIYDMNLSPQDRIYKYDEEQGAYNKFEVLTNIAIQFEFSKISKRTQVTLSTQSRNISPTGEAGSYGNVWIMRCQQN